MTIVLTAGAGRVEDSVAGDAGNIDEGDEASDDCSEMFREVLMKSWMMFLQRAM